MNQHFSFSAFYQELETLLPASSMAQRKLWVTTIVEQDIVMKSLSDLLKGDKKIAIRFLWLISEIGMEHPEKLLKELPYLFLISDQLKPEYKTSFANYWLIAGVPIENEGEAIDLLFQWLVSPETNVTIKARSFMVLYQLTQKYPELKNELKLSLEDQMDKYTISFKRRAEKIWNLLGG